MTDRAPTPTPNYSPGVTSSRQRVLVVALVALAVLAVVAVALSGGPGVGTPVPSATPTSASPSPTASPAAGSPSPTATTAAPTASSTPVPSARAALVTRRGEQTIIRSESDPTPIHTVRSLSVSPDGSRVAYWTESGRTAELRFLELGGSERVVARFPEKLGRGIAWSSDGTGLVVTLADRPATPTPTGDIARTLHAVDIASGSTRQVYELTGPPGPHLMPLAWRRDPELFVAYETGPGGYEFGYTVIRSDAAPVRSDPESDLIGMEVSSDGAFVGASSVFEDGTIKVWPLEDFSRQTELRPASGERIGQRFWWPGARAIVFAIGRQSGGTWQNTRIERWEVATGVRTVVRSFADTAQLVTFYPRADGSGLIVLRPDRTWEAIDLASGSATPIPLETGEVIVGTVLIR